MKLRLLWKLLLINVLPVICVIILLVWLAVDYLAADYFMVLMDRYDVSPTETHQMFLEAIHRYLIWASVVALALALGLSYLLTRRILRPLSEMFSITREVSKGHFKGRVKVTSEDEVGQLAQAFNRMADSLEQIEQLRKSMVVDIAHELRTPLTNLRGYLEGLSDQVIPPERATFQMLEQEILRLVRLVEDLQQLAKAEAAKSYLERSSQSLPELVEQLLALDQLHFEAQNIQVTTQFLKGAEIIDADRGKLLQALRNLIENARKYTPEGGWLKITAERESDFIKVTFANNGEGIPPADLPHIFERFYRADSSRSREHGGAGIGLSIVKNLAEAHGGSVGAESSPEETRIWIRLPA